MLKCEFRSDCVIFFIIDRNCDPIAFLLLIYDFDLFFLFVVLHGSVLQFWKGAEFFKLGYLFEFFPIFLMHLHVEFQ